MRLGCETQDAKRHWLCVIQVGCEHVNIGSHIILEVDIGDLEVYGGHCVVVSVVAVASTSCLKAWVRHILGSKNVTSDCRQHKGVLKVIIEEPWHSSLSTPGVNRQHLNVILFLYGGLVVGDLHHQVSSSVVKHISSCHVILGLREDALSNLFSFIVVFVGNIAAIHANSGLKLFLGTSEEEEFSHVESE